MPTEQIMNSLVINKVDKTETLNAMKKMEDFDPSQVYVVEDPLGRIPVTAEEVEDYDTWIEPGTGASVLKYRDPSSGEIKKVGGGSTVHISDEPPVNPEESNVWIDTSEEGAEDSYYTKEQTEELVNNRIDAKFEELDPADIGAPTIEEMNAAIAAIPAPDYTGLATEDFATNAAAQVKNDLLNGAGSAYDTLKELGELIDDNVDAIEALEIVAASKANSSDLTAHTGNKENPHGVTAAQVGALELVNAAGMNLDTILTSGIHYKIYRINDTTEKTPFTEGVSARKYGLVLSYASSAAYGHQFAMLAGAECLFHRTNVNGTISQWSQIYSQNWKPSAADVGAVAVSTYHGDMNDLLTDGFYRVGENANLPPALYYSQVIVSRGSNSDTVAQIGVSYDQNKMFFRGYNGRNGWQKWSEVATTDYALARDGSNSMTGSLMIGPTGAAQVQIASAENMLYMSAFPANDYGNRRMIRVADKNGASTLGDALCLVDVVNNSPAFYPIYHTGNKPTAADVGALSTSGGTVGGNVTLDGNLDLKKVENGYGRIYKNHSSSADYGTQMTDYDANGNYTSIQARTATGEGAIVITSKDGTTTTSKIYHEGNKPPVDTALSSTSANPVQNKVINTALASKAATATYEATVTTSWTASGSYFYQNITVTGITANDNPIVGIKTGTDNAANKLYSESFGKVIRIVTAANKITVYATEAIGTAFPIQLKVVR